MSLTPGQSEIICRSGVEDIDLQLVK